VALGGWQFPFGRRAPKALDASRYRGLVGVFDLDAETVPRAWSDVLNLARAHNLSVYDAAYLELALRRGLPVATLDEGLKAAAKAVGVAEYKP
jgi:predicted nucleic acid-binding protein